MTHPRQLGPFRIDRLIGRGGMGAVYQAEYEDIATPLAIKVLLDPMEEDSELRSRFEAEIETLRRLRHPNIVRLFGFGQEDGLLYYAMEFVDGPSLQEILRRKHFFTWEEVVHIGSQVAQALRHAHDRGIIHRDIKPANILLPETGIVKVSDYGIAHLFGGVRLTDANMVIGTIEYMSPEQASAGPITPKSDLYSFGALLYVLLAGVPPYGIQTKSLPELLQKYRQGPPESVRYRRPDVPLELDVLLQDLLQVAVDKRPANAQIVQRRLETILGAYAKTGVLAKIFEKEDAASKQTVGHKIRNGNEKNEVGDDQESGGNNSRVDYFADDVTVSSHIFGDGSKNNDSACPVPSSSNEDPAVTLIMDAERENSRPLSDGGETAPLDGNFHKPEKSLTEDGMAPTLPLTSDLRNSAVETPASSVFPVRGTPADATRDFTATETEGKSGDDSADFTLSLGASSSFHGDLSDLGEKNSGDGNRGNGNEPGRTVTTRILSEKEKSDENADFEVQEEKSGSAQRAFSSSSVLSDPLTASNEDSDSSSPDIKGTDAKKSHFILVSEEELDPFQREEEKSPYVSIQVLVFSMILLSVGVLFWYALRRPSADALYEKIEKEIGDRSSESNYLSVLRLLDDDFEKFLSYYPNDSRTEKVRGYAEELELANLERRLEQQIERGRSRSALSVVEEAYIEAIRTLESDPEKGRKKLVAFIDIFSFGVPSPNAETFSDPSETESEKVKREGGETLPEVKSEGNVSSEDFPYAKKDFRAGESDEKNSLSQTLPGQCVILAQRRLEQVKKDYEQKKKLETELLESHFGLADSLEATDPERANQIRRGLIDFYGDRPWAEDLVRAGTERIRATSDAQNFLQKNPEPMKDTPTGTPSSDAEEANGRTVLE